ncbi:MAG: metalloprotease [Methanobrevibacter sp.]|nr:metalloprotease [Methanobrevibacter sp.]
MKGFDFSKNEIRDLIITFVVLTIAFSILCSEEFSEMPRVIPIVMIAVGLGSIAHEVAIKMSAMRFNFWAEYKASLPGLFIATITSFGGFVFSAPGSVYIYGNANNKQNGLICLSGVVSNALLTIVFLVLAVLMRRYGMGISGLDTALIYDIFEIGFITNGSMAFFNAFPFNSMDGAAVFKWNPIIWFIMIAFALAIVWVGQTIFQI